MAVAVRLIADCNTPSSLGRCYEMRMLGLMRTQRSKLRVDKTEVRFFHSKLISR